MNVYFDFLVVTCVHNCFLLCADEDDYENLNVTPYSTPPDLPDVMKPTDRATTA